MSRSLQSIPFLSTHPEVEDIVDAVANVLACVVDLVDCDVVTADMVVVEGVVVVKVELGTVKVVCAEGVFVVRVVLGVVDVVCVVIGVLEEVLDATVVGPHKPQCKGQVDCATFFTLQMPKYLSIIKQSTPGVSVQFVPVVV